MVIGSKAQLQSQNLDQFSINLGSDKYIVYQWNIILVGMTCKIMNYYVNAICRLHKEFPKQLLLKVYKPNQIKLCI